MCQLRVVLLLILMIALSKANEHTKVNDASIPHEGKNNNITMLVEHYEKNEKVSIDGVHYYTYEYLEILIEEERLNLSGSVFVINTIIVTFLVALAGLASGLTVGYLSIDELVLELKILGGTEEEKATSLIIQKVLSSKHRLLVTLLVTNAFAMEALPIFLGKLVPEWLAIVVSTTLVLFIGEVIPQAICTGPRQLEIAAAVAPPTYWLIWILSPINIPLGKLLDYLLGVHSRNRFMNTDLRTLIELHTYSSLKKLNLLHSAGGEKNAPSSLPSQHQIFSSQANTSNEKKKYKDIPLSDIGSISESHENEELSMSMNKPLDRPRKEQSNFRQTEDIGQSSIITTSHELLNGDLGLNEEQANLMISAIEMKEKKAIEVMIPISKTYMISYDDPIDNVKLSVILERGYSRIPVYGGSNPSDILGLVRIKQLIGIDLSEKKSMREHGIQLKLPLIIPPKLNLLDLLREFKKGKSHMAFITEQVKELQSKLNNIDKKFKNINKRENNNIDIKVLGIITLEDIIERLINIEILDEDDYEDMHKNKKESSNILKSKNYIIKYLNRQNYCF